MKDVIAVLQMTINEIGRNLEIIKSRLKKLEKEVYGYTKPIGDNDGRKTSDDSRK